MATKPKPEAPKCSVLLVDDDKDMLQMLSKVLTRKGYTTDTAESGSKALTKLKKDSSDIVISDVKMPRMDGHEVLQRMRANESTRALPVVILTSSDMEKDINTSYDLGASSFVSKPVKIDDFKRAIVQMGLYWLVLNKSPGSAEK